MKKKWYLFFCFFSLCSCNVVNFMPGTELVEQRYVEPDKGWVSDWKATITYD
jgi:hypothetical protein